MYMVEHLLNWLHYNVKKKSLMKNDESAEKDQDASVEKDQIEPSRFGPMRPDAIPDAIDSSEVYYPNFDTGK